MKKIVALLLVLVLSISLVGTAFAAELEFAPSIMYKDGPAYDDAYIVDEGTGDLDGMGVGDCIVITTVAQARDKSTDITQEERDTLIEVYEALSDGSMTLPLEGDYVIRDLVDISFEHEDCRMIEAHGQKDKELAKRRIMLNIDLDLEIGSKVEVIVLTYVNGHWIEIEEVANNGDGTVSCLFEDICPVAFVVSGDVYDPIPMGGDAMAKQLGLWIGVMAVAAIALVAIVVVSHKKKK